MKLRKIIYGLIFLLGIIGFVGCDTTDPGPDPDKDKEVTINDAYNWVLEQIPSETKENVTLPTSYEGYNVVWDSEDEEIITNSGVITRDKEDVDILLSFTITKNDEIKQGEEIITIKNDLVRFAGDWFISQFNPMIARDYEVKTTDMNYSECSITWSSSNQNVFTNEGKYIKPLYDVVFDISYTVTYGEDKFESVKSFTAAGYTIVDVETEVIGWIESQELIADVTTTDLDLPEKYEKLGLDITWQSDSPDILSHTGKVNRAIFGKEIILTGSVKFNDIIVPTTLSTYVPAKEVTTMEEKIINFLNTICVSELTRTTFGYYANINNSFAHLNFFTQNDDFGLVEDIRTTYEMGNRPGVKTNGNTFKCEYITVHDTANNRDGATALAHANYVANGGGGASYHYCVDENYTYHLIPDNEVAYHAGDGTYNPFTLIDSSIPAVTGKINLPKVTISDDGYYELDGQKSVVKAPLINQKIATEDYFSSSGIMVEVGENGNYYIGTTWYSSSYAAIGNYGGNLNSIGIETCVDMYSDYAATFKRTAKLVAKLLINNNLDVSRVKQHNFFSGKDCPLTIRLANKWEEFLYAVQIYKYGQTELKDVEFEWTSLSPIMDNTGKIAMDIGDETEVTYQVKVTYNNQSNIYTYTTKLIDKK